MKTLIAALALLTLAASPVFAARYVPQSAYDPNSPAFSDMIGGHHLDLNPPNPSGGIPGA